METLIKDHLSKWFLEHNDDEDDDGVDDIDGDEKTTNTSTDLLTLPDDIKVTAAAYIRSSTLMASTCDTQNKKAAAMMS